MARVLFSQMPRRSILSASLMITQSFVCNAIFFTCALVLGTVYHVASGPIRKPADGRACARAIADNYGLTYERITVRSGR